MCSIFRTLTKLHIYLWSNLVILKNNCWNIFRSTNNSQQFVCQICGVLVQNMSGTKLENFSQKSYLTTTSACASTKLPKLWKSFASFKFYTKILQIRQINSWLCVNLWKKITLISSSFFPLCYLLKRTLSTLMFTFC